MSKLFMLVAVLGLVFVGTASADHHVQAQRQRVAIRRQPVIQRQVRVERVVAHDHHVQQQRQRQRQVEYYYAQPVRERVVERVVVEKVQADHCPPAERVVERVRVHY